MAQIDRAAASRAIRPVVLCVAVATAYALLAVVHTYPLISNLGTHLPGVALMDNVSFVWNQWWMREAIASPEFEFWRSPMVFAPFGASLVLHTHTALAAAAGATLLARLGPVEAQNVILIASLCLNGVAMYLLALQTTRSTPSSIAAGALFVVAPAVTARLMGHYNLVLVWPLILACASYIAWLRHSSWWRSVMLGVVASSIPYADYYYAVYFVLLAAVYFATEFWSVHATFTLRRHRVLSRVLLVVAVLALAAAVAIRNAGPSVITIGSLRISARSPMNALTTAWLFVAAAALATWKVRAYWRRRPAVMPRRAHTAVALLILLLLTAPLTIGALQLAAAGDYATQSASLKSSARGVDPATLLMGPPFNGLAGARVRDAYVWAAIDSVECSAWLGSAVTILLVLSLRRLRRAREIRRWTSIGAVFMVWALGPYLQVLGEDTGLLLPQAVAYVVPVLNNARIPGRAILVATFCVVMLVALFLATVEKRRLASWVLVVVGVLESLAAPLALAPLPESSVHGGLAFDGRREAAVLPLPFGVRDGFGEQGSFQHAALYAQTIHGHALAGGFLARVPATIFKWYRTTEPYSALLKLSAGEDLSLPACADVVAGLRAGTVSYVVLDRAAASPALVRAIEAQMPLRRIDDSGSYTLFSVAPERCNGR